MKDLNGMESNRSKNPKRTNWKSTDKIANANLILRKISNASADGMIILPWRNTDHSKIFDSYLSQGLPDNLIWLLIADTKVKVFMNSYQSLNRTTILCRIRRNQSSLAEIKFEKYFNVLKYSCICMLNSMSYFWKCVYMNFILVELRVSLSRSLIWVQVEM